MHLVTVIEVRITEPIPRLHLVEIQITSKIKITLTILLVEQDKVTQTTPIQHLFEIIVEITTRQDRIMITIHQLVQWILIRPILEEVLVEEDLQTVEEDVEDDTFFYTHFECSS